MVLCEGRSIEGHQAIPAALDRERQAPRQACQRVGVRGIGVVLDKHRPVGVAADPQVIESHRQVPSEQLQGHTGGNSSRTLLTSP